MNLKPEITHADCRKYIQKHFLETMGCFCMLLQQLLLNYGHLNFLAPKLFNQKKALTGPNISTRLERAVEIRCVPVFAREPNNSGTRHSISPKLEY